MAVQVRLYPTNQQPPQPPTAAAATTPSGATSFFDTPIRDVLLASLLAAGLFLVPQAGVQPYGANHVWPDPNRLEKAPLTGDFALGSAAPFQPQAWVLGEVARKRPIGVDHFTIQLVGTVNSTTPQGYDAVFPVLFSRKFPATAQQVTQFQPQGDQNSTPQGWVGVFPERFAKKFPVNAQPFDYFPPFQVPTQFIGNAWIVAWDGPARARFPGGAQQVTQWQPRGDLVSTPQGWPAVFPERFARAFPYGLQQHFETAEQQVPTATSPQGWPAVYPERFAARFPPGLQRSDQPTLAAYGTVIITYPEGWRGVFPELAGKRFPVSLQQVEGLRQGALAVVYPEGWRGVAPERAFLPPPDPRGAYTAGTTLVVTYAVQVSEPLVLRRPARSSDEIATRTPAFAAPQGWQGTDAPSPRFARREGTGIAASFVQAFRGQAWDVWPAPQARKTPAGLLEAPGTIRGAQAVTPTPTQFGEWPEFSWRFRRIVPPGADFFRLFRITPVIISTPTLLGESTRPTLHGGSTAPVLLAEKAQATLHGMSTAAQLLGESTRPVLKGEV